MKCKLATRFIDINLESGEIREGAIDENPFRLTFDISTEKAYILTLALNYYFLKSEKGRSFLKDLSDKKKQAMRETIEEDDDEDDEVVSFNEYIEHCRWFLKGV